MATTRLLFLLLLLANLAYLTVVSLGSDPSLAQALAATVAPVPLAWIWILVARRGRFPAWASLVCGGAFALVSYGTPTLTYGGTLLAVGLLYRGVFGGDAFTHTDQLSGMPYRAVLLYLAGYLGGRLFEQGDTTRLVGDLLFLVPLAVSATVIGRVLARNAAGRDRALQRELQLNEAIRALGSTTDPTELHQVVVQSALTLLGSIGGARVTLLVPEEDGYTAIAAGGSGSSTTLGLHADVLPPSLAAALHRGGAHWLTPEEVRELAEATHAPGFKPFALMLPLRAGGQAVSVRFAGFPTRPPREFVNALGVLAGDAASELQSAALSAQLAHQARHDALTGLANRAEFGERLAHAVAGRADRADRAEGGLAVAFLDLDDFKPVNDTLGHAAGDDVLKAVANRLAGGRRSSDVVARLGGDEFAVVLDPIADEAEACSVARRLHDAVSHPVAVSGGNVPCSASVGVALWTPGLSADQLLAHADTAMYAAKEHKDCVASYDSRLAADASGRAVFRSALEHGLRHGQVEVYYQPVFDSTDLSLASFEALARWRHPSLGLLGPDAFIPLDEQTGLIVELGRHVLRTACEQLRDWQQRHPAAAEATIAVNVSVRELEEPGYVDMVTAILSASGLSPDRLVLEVTESLLMTDGHPGIARLSDLHRLGVRIAIDDFGTGYSALARLRSFPVSHLKLDRTFVTDVESDPFAAALATAILAMSRSLDMDVVAEGVETAEQLEWLRSRACAQAQGYLFSTPSLAADLEDLIRAGHPLRDAPGGAAEDRLRVTT